MKILLALLLSLNFGTAAVFAQRPPAPLLYKAPSPTELKEFTAADKSFSITFPGVAKTSKRDMDKAIVTISHVYRPGSNSAVSVYEFKNDLEVMGDDAFGIYKNSILKAPKIKLEAEREITLDGKAAKEYDLLEDLKFAKIRLVISGNRLYELKQDVTNWHILSKFNKDKAAAFEKETKRFFDSFRLLESTGKKAIPLNFLGISDETKYENTFFGFSLEFPETWHNVDPLEIEARKDAGLAALKTNKEKVDRAFTAAVNREVIIFAVSKTRLEPDGGENLLVAVSKLAAGESDSKEILIASKSFLLSNPKIKLLEDVENVRIAGVEFSTLLLETTIGDRKIRQRVCVTLRSGYVLNFTLSYLDENGRKSLDEILRSVKFSAK